MKFSFSLHTLKCFKIDDWLIVLDFAGNTIEDDKFSVSTLIEKANRNVGMYVPHGLFVLSGSNITISIVSNEVNDDYASAILQERTLMSLWCCLETSQCQTGFKTLIPAQSKDAVGLEPRMAMSMFPTAFLLCIVSLCLFMRQLLFS